MLKPLFLLQSDGEFIAKLAKPRESRTTRNACETFVFFAETHNLRLAFIGLLQQYFC